MLRLPRDKAAALWYWHWERDGFGLCWLLRAWTPLSLHPLAPSGTTLFAFGKGQCKNYRDVNLCCIAPLIKRINSLFFFLRFHFMRYWYFNFSPHSAWFHQQDTVVSTELQISHFSWKMLNFSHFSWSERQLCTETWRPETHHSWWERPWEGNFPWGSPHGICITLQGFRKFRITQCHFKIWEKVFRMKQNCFLLWARLEVAVKMSLGNKALYLT